MKRFLILGFLVALFFTGNAQIYKINQYNNQYVLTCSGTFYDSGGSTAGYSAGQVYIVTFCPTGTGGYSNINFTQWNVGFGDALEVYDGPSTTSPLMATFTSTVSPIGNVVAASITNNTGCLTFKWTSVGTGVGWAATLGCGLPCQLFTTQLVSSVPPFHLDSGIYYIDICPHDTVTVTASNTYTYNNQLYHQSDSTSTFQWDMGNGTSSNSLSFTTVYDSIRGYNILLNTYDTIGCIATNDPEIRVRVSTPPTFVGTDAMYDPICQNDTNTLTGMFDTKPWSANFSLNTAGTTFLPDGSGVSYTSALVFSSFGLNQTLTHPSQLIGICANMEHSYLGDLNITITCPNGSSSTLKAYPGGAGTFIGEPIDNQANLSPGVGYDYCWKPTGTTTMVAAAGTYTHTFTDLAGTTYTNASFLPPSTSYPAASTAGAPYPIVTYSPVTPFTSLVGCPLNGAWTITVTDNLLIDNGYIFNWGIEFAQSILPSSWSYEPMIVTQAWNPNTTIITSVGGVATVQSPTPGPYTYVYTIVDDFGCSYDTSVTVNIVAQPNINLGSDTVLCGQHSITLDANPGTSNSTFSWNTVPPSTTQTVTINQAGTYDTDFWVVATSTGSGISCTDVDTINIKQFIVPNLFLGNDTLICEGDSIYIYGAALVNDTSYQLNWFDGSTADYYVEYNSEDVWLQISNGYCGTSDTVSITVANYPNVDLGKDTLVCNGNDYILDATNPGATYNWQDGSSNPTYSVLNTGNYWVAANNLGCITYDTVFITIGNQPTPFMEPIQQFCIGQKLVLNPGLWENYLWSNGSTQDSLIVAPDSVTSYSVVVWDAAGCSDSIGVEVHPIEMPDPVITSSADSICLGETIILDVVGGENYLWNNGSVHDHLELRPTQTTIFEVTASNSFNGLKCNSKAGYFIYAEDCNKFYVPNAFTPNGDGLNDDFGPHGQFYLDDYEIFIYNRWGELVFHSTDVFQRWDGQSYKGEDLPTGVYSYLIKLTKPFIDPFELRGTVLMLK